MARFPSVQLLAAASEHTVLKHWEGLGYYSRARSLRRAAQIVMRAHNGEIPADISTLQSLPGVGAYTAAAVAAIAYGKDEPALDANIRRVLARVFDVRHPLGSPEAERRIRTLAAQILPRGRAGDFNQALMDLGALVCLPRGPRCLSCPIADLCAAKRTSRQAQLPVRAAEKRRRQVSVGALVVSRKGRVLLGRRPSRGLLGGMWEFPKTELAGGPGSRARIQRRLPVAMRDVLNLQIRRLEPFTQVVHAYSHYTVVVEAFRCSMDARSAPPGFRWASVRQLSRYPMGRVDRMIANRLQQVPA